MRRLELRCCCDPGLLLGWLDVPDEWAVLGRRLTYAVAEMPAAWPDWRPPTLRRVELEVAEVGLSDFFSPVTAGVGFGDALHAARETRLAVKSNDTPLALLRLVPGFTENAEQGEG